MIIEIDKSLSIADALTMMCRSRDHLLEIMRHPRDERFESDEERHELLALLEHAISLLRAGQRAEAEALEGNVRRH